MSTEDPNVNAGAGLDANGVATNVIPPPDLDAPLPEEEQTYHACPSCGFIHESDSEAVPAIIVQETRMPTLEELHEFLSNQVRALGLTIDSTVRQALDALGTKIRPPAADAGIAGMSECPVCTSLGAVFRTDNAEMFNAHMGAGKHGPEEQNGKPPAPPA